MESVLDVLLAVKRDVEQRDHDYSLHLEKISEADNWSEADMTIYSATVGGVLALLDEHIVARGGNPN